MARTFRELGNLYDIVSPDNVDFIGFLSIKGAVLIVALGLQIKAGCLFLRQAADLGSVIAKDSRQ
jgi:hypothetical protein